MPEPLTLRAAAAALAVSESTLRLWVQRGAPTVREGSAGRGRGALVDINEIRRWRAARAGIAIAKPMPADLHAAVARGLLAAYKHGNNASSRTASVLAEAFNLIFRELAGRDPRDDEVPDEAQTLNGLAVLPYLRQRHP